MVKILGIMGSPRKGKSNDTLLDAALDKIKENADVEKIVLADYNIQPCTGCDTCVRQKPCPLEEEDDMGTLNEKLQNADGIIIASPSYFGGVPGILKNFMDRSRPLKMAGHGLKDKVFGFISSSGLKYGGQHEVVSALTIYAFTHGGIVVGAVGKTIEPNLALGSFQGDKIKEFRAAAEDEIALKTSELLATHVLEVAEKISK
ncbi:MAG: flavodoxin family protein [Promethearchaeota archaeon]|nr:MAG: flavodoxin family protein [Candidatus Lokiarchaeota archaeon]